MKRMNLMLAAVLLAGPVMAAEAPLPGNDARCKDARAKLITTLYKDFLGRPATLDEAIKAAGYAVHHKLQPKEYAGFMVMLPDYHVRVTMEAARMLLNREAYEEDKALGAALGRKDVYIRGLIHEEFTGPLPDPNDDGALYTWSGTWIKKVYKRMIGRSASLQELEYWRDAIFSARDQGQELTPIATAMYDSHANHETLVRKAAEELLFREPKASELASVAGSMDNKPTMTDESLRAQIGGSDEYIKKAVWTRTDVCAPSRETEED
ncbi:MAG: hypothetical protein WC728_15410 [Elusimicrobiota bacterium]